MPAMNTNTSIAALVDAALASGRVLTVRCPNGDTVTAGRGEVLRWGRSRFAHPSGKSVSTLDGVGRAVVEHCGRGNAAKAVRA